MVYLLENPQNAQTLFTGWEETLIWSCLQNVMGKVYGDDPQTPESAAAVLGDFCCFAGKPDKELVSYKPDGSQQDFIIMIPQNEQWAAVIEECYLEKAKKVVRYAIKKEYDIFSADKLSKIVEALPREYSIQLMDERLFVWCKEQDWCKDWVSQYKDYEEYEEKGLGVVILKDGYPVSGASSYSSFQGGIEIEIDTKEEYRRKGLAYICGAGLILECLKRKLYPSWDAQNKWSVALAEKLGYHYDHDYTAYEIWGY